MINIGVNGFDNYGCEVTSLKKIPNYQYDCVNPTPTDCSTNGGNNFFNNVCLGTVTEKTEKHQFLTLVDMLKSHNLEDKPITLKIDCEGCEFPGLKNVPVSALDNIDQIVGEFHIFKVDWGILDIVKTLTEKFVMVNTHMNNWGCHTPESGRKLKASAVEYAMVNRNIIKLKSNSQSFVNHPLNTPTKLNTPDCQVPELYEEVYVEVPLVMDKGHQPNLDHTHDG